MIQVAGSGVGHRRTANIQDKDRPVVRHRGPGPLGTWHISRSLRQVEALVPHPVLVTVSSCDNVTCSHEAAR